jgi:hypothetical protein
MGMKEMMIEKSAKDARDSYEKLRAMFRESGNEIAETLMKMKLRYKK